MIFYHDTHVEYLVDLNDDTMEGSLYQKYGSGVTVRCGEGETKTHRKAMEGREGKGGKGVSCQSGLFLFKGQPASWIPSAKRSARRNKDV